MRGLSQPVSIVREAHRPLAAPARNEAKRLDLERPDVDSSKMDFPAFAVRGPKIERLICKRFYDEHAVSMPWNRSTPIRSFLMEASLLRRGRG